MNCLNFMKTEKFFGNTKIWICIQVFIWIAAIIFGVYAIPKYVMQRTIVSGHSMDDNYFDGENVLVNKLSYKVSKPERFDTIVFYPYGKKLDDSFVSFVQTTAKRIYNKVNNKKSTIKQDEYYIKRVIGLPGETVQIKGSNIYIDGKILDEDYGMTDMTYSGVAEDPITLGKDQYFVLGDNRAISKDSRVIGAVNIKNIAGKVVYCMT